MAKEMVKLSPVRKRPIMKMYARMEIKLRLFLISAFDGSEEVSRFGRFTQGNTC
jgi:hypothetical protein